MANRPAFLKNPRRILPSPDNPLVEPQFVSQRAGSMNSESRVTREEMLRKAVLAGDEQAWRIWYDESFQPLYQFAVWRCGGSRDSADDLVQETWLTAVRQLRSFDPQRASFIAWLRGIAVNVRRNQTRCQRRASVGEQALTREHAKTNHFQLDPSDQNEAIAAALDALPERHEAVLRAKYLDGLSVAEIAATWRKHPRQSNHCSRALAKVFAKLSKRLKGKNMELPDDHMPLFVPQMATLENEKLRNSLLVQTTGMIRRRRRLKRTGVAAALLGCYLAGAGTMSLWQSSAAADKHPKAEIVMDSINPKGSTAPGSTGRLVRPEDDQVVDASTKQSVEPKLTPYDRLRQAGDMQLEQRGDIAAAARKYQQALRVASHHERAIALDQDSWLLMALKNDQASTNSLERTQ